MARKSTVRSRGRTAEKSDKAKKASSKDQVDENGQSDVERVEEDESQPEPPASNRRDQRERDEAVERATRGLIRLEGRRRRRTLLRWSIQLALVGSILGGAIYYGFDYIPTEQVQRYWQELKAKLPIIDDLSEEPEAPSSP